MLVGKARWKQWVGEGTAGHYLSTKGNVLDQHMGDNHTGARRYGHGRLYESIQGTPGGAPQQNKQNKP